MKNHTFLNGIKVGTKTVPIESAHLHLKRAKKGEAWRINKALERLGANCRALNPSIARPPLKKS